MQRHSCYTISGDVPEKALNTTPETGDNQNDNGKIARNGGNCDNVVAANNDSDDSTFNFKVMVTAGCILANICNVSILFLLINAFLNGLHSGAL